MKNININDHGLILRNISEKEAESVYLWYTNEKDYKDATGLNSGLSLQEFYNMWSQSLLNLNEFFLSISFENLNRCLGFIKGEIIHEKGLAVYISAFAVEKKSRRLMIGTYALNALSKFLKEEKGCENIFVTVYKDNEKGLNFWFKNGFIKVKDITKQDPDSNSLISAVLLKKEI